MEFESGALRRQTGLEQSEPTMSATSWRGLCDNFEMANANPATWRHFTRHELGWWRKIQRQYGMLQVT